MTKEEIRKECLIGISEDINGELYSIYDFDKLWKLLHQVDQKRLDKLAKKEAESPIYQVCSIERAVELAYKTAYTRAKEE